MITSYAEGKRLLEQKNAQLIDEIKHDTWSRKLYEANTPEGTEVWIEHESRLEYPEYYYNLWRYTGEVWPLQNSESDDV